MLARRTSWEVKLLSSQLETGPADEVNLVALQVMMAALGFGQHLHRSDQDAEGLGEQGNGRMEFDIHDRIWVALGI